MHTKNLEFSAVLLLRLDLKKIKDFCAKVRYLVW